MRPKLQAILRRERRLKLGAVVSLLIALAVIVLTVDNLLLSCVLAFVINYLIAPLVNFFERKHLPRTLAILIPFLAFGVLLSVGIYLVAPLISAQLSALEASLPGYQKDLVELIARTESRFRVFFKLYHINFSEIVNNWIITKTSDLSSALPGAINTTLSVSILAPFLGYFMLQDGRSLSKTILSMVPNSLFEPAVYLSHQINEQLGGFIRARFLEAAIVGLVVWVGLLVIHFPYATLLGIFAAIMNLIPYIGPIVGAVPAIVIALISPQAAVADTVAVNLFIVSSVYLVAQLIDVLFIIPLVVAKIVNLHPVTVVVVIIIGSQVLGILGMMISIPIASALKLTLSTIYQHQLNTRS